MTPQDLTELHQLHCWRKVPSIRDVEEHNAYQLPIYELSDPTILVFPSSCSVSCFLHLHQ